MDSLYDRVLLEVGTEGKFQKRFDVVYNVVFACLWSMVNYNMILALTLTPHTCKLPERPENISEYSWKTRYIPRVENVAETDKYSECLIYKSLESNETEACDFFDYDKTWFETTVISDNNWVCDNYINVLNIFTYSRIGEAVGSLFFGWFGDIYGRKPTYIISLALLIMGRFISVMASSSFLFFTIGYIIASFPSWSAPQNIGITSIEISSPKRRATVAKLRLIAISFGMCLASLFYWWLRNWKLFVIITTASQVPFLLFSWKLIESPQWLWINGKSKATLRCLKLIAKVNKTSIHPDTENELLIRSPNKTGKTEALGPLGLFSSWRIGVNTTLQLFLWIAVSSNYTVVVYTAGEKTEGNPFLAISYQALAEIPGYFIGTWMANYIGRRYTAIGSFASTTLIWIVYGYREISSIGWIQSEWIGTALGIMNRCSLTVSYYIVDLFNMELYPTCLRQSGMSLGNLASGAAAAVAPYIIFLGHVDRRYPSAVLIAITLICGILSTFFLPETLNVKLPETLEDAKKIGCNKINRVSHFQASLESEEL